MLTYDEIADNQIIQPRGKERLYRILGRANDGIAFEVEGRVHHHRHAGEFLELLDQRIVTRVGGPLHRLHPATAVHVDYRRDFVRPRFVGPIAEDHVGRIRATLEVTAALSFSTLGANGRQPSRNFTASLTRSRLSAKRGSDRMERAPRARGPNSMRPWNQPTRWFLASNSAAVREGFSTR